jgi:hypothetical protein
VKKITFVVFLIIGLFSHSTSVFAFSGDNHTEITTQALNFLKPDVLEEIISGNAGGFDAANQLNPEVHFDGCNFREGFAYINQQYELITLFAGEGDIRTPSTFGHILHAAQDLYAHSNLVEIGVSYIGEDSYSLWNDGQEIMPYTLTDGRIYVEGEPPSGFTLTFDNASKTISVTDTIHNQNYIGVISGMAYSRGQCPTTDIIGHWDRSNALPEEPGLFPGMDEDYGTGLNKDDDSRPGFQIAYDLAVQQAQHEWCRLLYLVAKEASPRHAQQLLDRWVAPENQQTALQGCAGFTLRGIHGKEVTDRNFDFCSDTYQRLAYPIIPVEAIEALGNLSSQVDGIDDAEGVYYYDAYAIVVEMPPNVTPEEILADAAFNLEWYLSAAIFNPTGNIWFYHEQPQWESGLPVVGDVYHEDINFTGTLISPKMSGAKMFVEVAPNRIVYTTITRNGEHHPVPGTREIGFEVNQNNFVTFYTRSVARAGHSLVAAQPSTSLAVSDANGYVFSSQEAWVHWIAGINKKITELEGTVIDPIARAINTSPEKPVCE